ncbi:MAG: phosphoribosyltransferase [Alphaproteobacteria bacterium]
MNPLFKNRPDAGRKLAPLLQGMEKGKESLILALPRGGVPVAHEIARLLKLPMDILLVRKLGVPGHEELAMGAIAYGGSRVMNHDVVDVLNIPDAVVEAVASMETAELQRRNRVYREGRPPPRVKGRDIVLVDDGLATGATMHAAIMALRRERAASITVAAPVGAPDTCRRLEVEADSVICLHQPEPFYGVGVWYEDFSQTEDTEVLDLLRGKSGGTDAWP